MKYSNLSVWSTVLCAASASVSVSASETASETVVHSDYTVWCSGNCNHDKHTESSPGAVLMGGGTDTNEAFAWQISNANGGDFVVMRASGDDAYNEYIYDMSIATNTRLNSVRTILFNNAKASAEPEVLDIINNAEAIFFAGMLTHSLTHLLTHARTCSSINAKKLDPYTHFCVYHVGGDQNQYMTYWADTEVQSIIQGKLGNITLGGTSAGLAVLGQWVYTAEDGTVYSDEAMEVSET